MSKNIVIYPNNTVCVNGKLFRDIDSEKFMKRIPKKLKPALNDVYDKRIKIRDTNYMIFRKKENDLRAI